jgi:hypothetical protein
MTSGTVAAITRWPSRETLAVTDDAPVTWREVFSHIADAAGAPSPQEGGRIGVPSFRVSNQGASEALGLAPFYGDYRSGLAR